LFRYIMNCLQDILKCIWCMSVVNYANYFLFRSEIIKPAFNRVQVTQVCKYFHLVFTKQNSCSICCSEIVCIEASNKTAKHFVSVNVEHESVKMILYQLAFIIAHAFQAVGIFFSMSILKHDQ